MNKKHKQTPEVIGTLRIIDKEGNDNYVGDKVIGIQVQSPRSGEAFVQFDIREMKSKNGNLILEIELAELVSALSLATLKAESY